MIDTVSSLTPNTPLEIWLESLREEGVDTSAIRMWMEWGLLTEGWIS